MLKKKSRNIGAEILEGIRQIKRGEIGRVTSLPPVSETRARAGLCQSEFARLLGVSVQTLQESEQGQRGETAVSGFRLGVPRSLEIRYVSFKA